MRASQYAAYQAGVRLSQCLILASESIGHSQASLVSALMLLSGAFSKLANAPQLKLDEDAIKNSRQLLREATRIARRALVGLDADRGEEWRECRWRLKSVRQLLDDALRRHGDGGDAAYTWFLLGLEITDGYLDSGGLPPRPVPPGSIPNFEYHWVHDNPDTLDRLLSDAQVCLDDVFPTAAKECEIPELADSLADWGRIETGLEDLASRVVSGGNPNEARDRFIYDSYMDGLLIKNIRSAVNATEGWGNLGTDKGVSRAMKGYCKRHNLPVPPPRKRGRPKKQR